MGFLGVYTALYDYHPQAQGELELREGDLLYLLESSNEDDWWKAKKKAEHDDEDEPEGLVPNNYIEEVRVHLKALCSSVWNYRRHPGCPPGLPSSVRSWWLFPPSGVESGSSLNRAFTDCGTELNT